MFVQLTQKLPKGGTQPVFINTDNIERILPYDGGSIVNGVGGTETVVVETPERVMINAKE